MNLEKFLTIIKKQKTLKTTWTQSVPRCYFGSFGNMLKQLQTFWNYLGPLREREWRESGERVERELRESGERLWREW